MEKMASFIVRKSNTENKDGSLWDLIRFEALQGEAIMGFIKVSFIPSTKIKMSNIEKDILAYLKISTGPGAGIVPHSYISLEQSSQDMLKSIAHGVEEEVHGWPYANQKQRSEVSRQDYLRRISDCLPEIERRFDHERQSFLEFHVDKPQVDMVEVSPAFRRKGVGLALYEFASAWARGRGMSLHASKIQTQEAMEVWESLRRRDMIDQGEGTTKDCGNVSRQKMR